MVVLGFLLVFIIAVVVALARNSWVYRRRVWLIHNEWEHYYDYWDYEKMMWHFWIWDVNKMKG